MKNYDYDIIVIGLGPAGMAVSAMAAEAGLKVLAVEKNKIGGECMNVGCIPSKALLRIAKKHHYATEISSGEQLLALPDSPFEGIQKDLEYISSKKTIKMLEKVQIVLNQGAAQFVDAHTISVGNKRYSAKFLFLCTGTKPFIPPIPGLEKVPYLTNENIFFLKKIPKSITILGGGAIGTEMAQAFARLGGQVRIVHMDAHLIPGADPEAGELLQKVFHKEGIEVLNSRRVVSVEKPQNEILVYTDKQEIFRSEAILVATGRRQELQGLGLERIGVEFSEKGIKINDYLQTTHKHLFAIGDINGWRLFSHAAMHQGMLAFMNTLLPRFFRFRFKNYVVPWTVFTDPQVSQVGQTEAELKQKKLKYEVVSVPYSDYGAAIAEKLETGFIRALISPWGKIYGVSIVGEGSGEMINEWALAIQKKIKIYDIMMLQHSFPTMGFLTKRIAETWAMGKMKPRWVKWIIRLLFGTR